MWKIEKRVAKRRRVRKQAEREGETVRNKRKWEKDGQRAHSSHSRRGGEEGHRGCRRQRRRGRGRGKRSGWAKGVAGGRSLAAGGSEVKGAREEAEEEEREEVEENGGGTGTGQTGEGKAGAALPGATCGLARCRKCHVRAGATAGCSTRGLRLPSGSARLPGRHTSALLLSPEEPEWEAKAKKKPRQQPVHRDQQHARQHGQEPASVNSSVNINNNNNNATPVRSSALVCLVTSSCAAAARLGGLRRASAKASQCLDARAHASV